LFLARLCDRTVELLIDLESQLPTRRYFNTLLDDHHIILHCRYRALPTDMQVGSPSSEHRFTPSPCLVCSLCRRSRLFERKDAALFRDLVGTLAFYVSFEINDHSGLALKPHEVTERVRWAPRKRCVGGPTVVAKNSTDANGVLRVGDCL